MTPTDLLLYAPFRSLAPQVYTDDTIAQRFALSKVGGGPTINRLASEVWAHTFEGYVEPTQLRCGTLFDALGGSNVSGLVLEHWRDNLLGNINWTAQPVVNGSVASAPSASFAINAPASGFTLTSAAAGDCYIEIAGPFTWANLDVVYSVAGIGGPAFIGCNVDGTISPANFDIRSWRWLTFNDTTGAAPAAFRVGFTALAAGETCTFAWPQVEPGYGTSPILDGQRQPETLVALLEQVCQTGRVNLEIDTTPNVEGGAGLNFEVAYTDANNAIRLVYDGTVNFYRCAVTVGGITVQSDPLDWAPGIRFRLFVEFGNGRPRVAWKIGETATQCASGPMTTTQAVYPSSGPIYVPGRAQIGVLQFGGVFGAINFWPNGDRPDWVGCVCGS